MADKQILTIKGKPKNKIDCIAWLLLNVFGCDFCKTCRDKPCKIKDGECCTDNIAKYIRETVIKEADVVPRSEYEDLEFQFKELDIECDRLEKVETDFYEAVKQVKREVAKKLTRQIRMAIMAHGTKYAMKELAKIEKEYMGE